MHFAHIWRRLAAIAFAFACAASGTTHAQSSVTLYGLVDASIAYVTNQKGGQTVQLFAGDAQASRLGFAGTEDLGNGYKAIFRLENGFTVDNGAAAQGGLLFGRQAYVGLASDQFGTMTLGRQYDFALDYLCPLSNGCISSIVFGFHLGDYDRLGGERLDHAVKYTSPDLGGLQFGALYSLGGQPGSLSKNSATSVGASYRSGPVQVGASYTAIRNFTAAFDLGTPVFGTSLAGLAVDKYSTGGVGASYRVGKVLLHGVGTFVDFQKNGQSVILRTGEAGVTYELTDALRLNAGYAYTTQGNLHWHQGILAANYFLSKRTDVYCHLSTLQASSGTRAALFPLTASDTSSQSLVSVGIRHKF